MFTQAQRTIKFIHWHGHPPPSRHGTTWPALVVLFLLCSTQGSHGHPSPLPPYKLGLLQTTTLLPLRTCAVGIDTHTYTWAGDPKLTMETSSGFILYPCRPGILDQDIWRRVNTVRSLAAGITPHILRYRTTTAHSGVWILQGVDDVAASC